MTRINTNVASLRGLRSLNKANSQLDTSLTRLSTGLKINSGKDNPSGLIASETLRSQISTIEQSIKNSSRATNVIGTADAALGEIGGLLNQVRALVQEGLNEGALSQEEIEANQLQIDAALSAINRISSNTTFAGDRLIDGSKAFRTEQTATNAAKLTDVQVNGAVFSGSSTITINTEIETAATKGELFYNTVTGGAGLASATALEVSGSKGTEIVFLGQGSTLNNIETAIDALTDSTGVEAIKTDAVLGSKAYDSTAANADLTFTDIRTEVSDDASLAQVVKIEFADKSAGASLGVTSSSNATEIKLTVTLAANAGNAVTSTAADVKALLEGDAASQDYIEVAVEGDGSGLVDEASGEISINSGQQDAFLTFRSTEFGSSEFVGVNALQGTFSTTKTSVSGSAADRVSGTDIVARINGQVAQGKGLRATLTTSSLDASIAFNESANGVSGNTHTLTITGGGSLFQIGQEVSAAGQLGIGIEGMNTARLGGISGKLYELGSGGGKSLLDVGPSTPGSDLVNIIEESISRVSTLRGRLGAIQKNVIETNISSLGVALENISEARSQIVDTDFAQETANLTKAQIISQAGISVLSIANQNPQQVLSLLG
ncbi:MAG: hypothetical protein KDA79_01225 [Planctomycetaceae bacterium]|nr:hypothetical protein [Planctomycetaceae bacterium]